MPTTIPKLVDTAQNYFEGGAESYDLEFRIVHKDGTLRWFLGRGRSVCDNEGRAIRGLILSRHHPTRGLQKTEVRKSKTGCLGTGGPFVCKAEATQIGYTSRYKNKAGLTLNRSARVRMCALLSWRSPLRILPPRGRFLPSSSPNWDPFISL